MTQDKLSRIEPAKQNLDDLAAFFTDPLKTDWQALDVSIYSNAREQVSLVGPTYETGRLSSFSAGKTNPRTEAYSWYHATDHPGVWTKLDISRVLSGGGGGQLTEISRTVRYHLVRLDEQKAREVQEFKRIGNEL